MEMKWYYGVKSTVSDRGSHRYDIEQSMDERTENHWLLLDQLDVELVDF